MNIFLQAKNYHDFFSLSHKWIGKTRVQIAATVLNKERKKIFTRWASRRISYAALSRVCDTQV
jgi:hypothetical protein